MENKEPASENDKPVPVTGSHRRLEWLWDFLLIIVLLVGAYFRLSGQNWDQNQHLHPDERFLTMVETAIEPVEEISQYFDTQNSSLNPNNRGYAFYVYGTLPLFIVRYAGELLAKTGYDQITLVGRQISAIMDLGTVLLVYFIAIRLYRSRAVALLAASFASFSVLPIQLSHYFTVDTFTNFFGMLAFFFAVCLLPAAGSREPGLGLSEALQNGMPPISILREWKSAGLFILFGFALGCAMASKFNAILLAMLLPGAVFIRFAALSSMERGRWLRVYVRNLFLAALTALVIFRIFQPYAFIGPGFSNIHLNPAWVSSMRALTSQSMGDVDFPPALQWARRSVFFALQNMVLWGVGLPLGILAWVGFLWMGYRIIKGGWRANLLVWAWTAVYFTYQSINWTRSMRYQMLVYPTLAIIAAWMLWQIWRHSSLSTHALASLWKAAASLLGLAVLILTFAWAYAFTRIYTRPVTRVEASRWIYQNVPGPINLQITTPYRVINQPVAFRSGFSLSSESPPVVLAFKPRHSGILLNLSFGHLVSPASDQVFKTLSVAVSDTPDSSNPLVLAQLADEFRADGDPRGKSYNVSFPYPVIFEPEKTYYLVLSLQGNGHSLDFAGNITLNFSSGQEILRQTLPEFVSALRAGKQFLITFEAAETGRLSEVRLNHVVDWEARPELKTLRLTVIDSEGNHELASSTINSLFGAETDPRGESYSFYFADLINVQKQRRYTLQLEQIEGPGALAVYGSKQVNESSWDDALPVGLDGYNPYDYTYGIYRSDLNFEMYWDDNLEKLDRFLSNLDQADYIFISSNRQWGTTTRLPERYPLTSEYYRLLLGCPSEREITWCYSVARPGMFFGDLGFELVAVFQSDPNLGGLRFNTQFAEEAFTVYDHPKVLIFKKIASYDQHKVRSLLGAVDLSTVVHVTPKKAGTAPANLLLPAERLATQLKGGTWALLFHSNSVFNRHPILAAILWYLAITAFGWIVFPFTRFALRSLPDRGYPLTRLVGMLLLAFPVWLLASYQVPFYSSTISAVVIFLVVVNLLLVFFQRNLFFEELRKNWRSFLVVEALALACFTLFLLVRMGNPDLWHPWKGGEKPMDFSYFNAVLKSTSFPPYDPWFAGGYINYYYFGFVLVGVVVKWLGILPSLAYNLILPTLFSLLALAAYSIGWNLASSTQGKAFRVRSLPKFSSFISTSVKTPMLAGLGSVVAVAVLGNWGTVRMIWHSLQRLGNMRVPFEDASFFVRVGWTLEGLWRLVSVPGTHLPYGPGDWYWIPSRAIPGEPITEFPAFTFLYADLHAHLIALPVSLLVLSWALSVVFGRWNWITWQHFSASFFLGAVAVGALRTTNTWDWPAFLALACLSVVYAAFRYSGDNQQGSKVFATIMNRASIPIQRIFNAVLGVMVLAGLSVLLYQPYSDWYGQAYSQIDVWEGAHTPFWSYMTHWGVFLFVIFSWVFWETIEWMAATPVSKLNVLRRVRGLLIIVFLVFSTLIVLLSAHRVEVAWLVLLLMAWAGVLLLRPCQADAKRIVFVFIITGLAMTLFVEVAVLRGDIGRMNTVFKFYLQAWSLLALSSGSALAWLFPAIARLKKPLLRIAWSITLILLIAGAAMFPILAGKDKITDRMVKTAPHTLDGMTYMAYAEYAEGDMVMDLSEDYRAIRWIQDNISGSPVIVEANVPEYRWGNRFTIYTGLPGVVGWNWHQRQQRALVPGEWVTSRIEAIRNFYNATMPEDSQVFLDRYRVQYIIVGQLERAVYSPSGIAKFAAYDGVAWKQVYSDGQTAIYKVIE